MRLAEIKDGSVVNVIVADAVPEGDYVVSDEACIGDLFVDGVFMKVPREQLLTDSDKKEIGYSYELNGEYYLVPLNADAQSAVTAITVAHLAGAFTNTVIHFSNGVKMPITAADWMPFAVWFATERNRFFL